MIFVRTDRSDFHQLPPLELRYGQSVDAVVLRMGADELHEGYLAVKIESDHQTVVSSCNFEPDTFAVQHLGFRSRPRQDLLARHQGPNLKFTPARITFSANGTVNGTAGPQFTGQDTLPRLM